MGNTDFEKLGRDYWEWVLKENPTYATFLGDHRYDDRLEQIDSSAREAQIQAVREFQRRLDAIDLGSLAPSDRISADILRLNFENTIEEIRHRFYQWNIDQMTGPQVSLFELLNWHPTNSDEGLEALAKRFADFPRYMRQYLDNLREGVAQGRVSPKVAVERVAAQLENILKTDPARSPLLPSRVSDAWRKRLIEAIRKHVYPAYESFAKFLRTYRAREAVGLSAIPGGREAYEFKVRYHTTTRLTAREIHEIGLEELGSLHAQMRKIARTRDLKGYLKKVQEDRGQCFSSREEILNAYRRMLDRCWAALPRWFGTLPKQKCDLKPIEQYREKDSVAAFYYPPPDDRSRPGIFYINTYQPERRPRYNTASLTVHEAIPGHHLQIALAQEQESLPPYRRHGGFTAYVEGWALYAELLGVEMGLYHDDLERFGMLVGQAFRASRLVVDTGLHAFEWPRRKAIEFHLNNTGMTDLEVVNEIDRYIIWPGQALAYMIGRREIQACRRRAEKALGRKFDIRKFHDVVLLNGAVPLTTLRSIVDEWVGTKKSRVRTKLA